jgi:hypothetical protein
VIQTRGAGHRIAGARQRSPVAWSQGGGMCTRLCLQGRLQRHGCGLPSSALGRRPHERGVEGLRGHHCDYICRPKHSIILAGCAVWGCAGSPHLGPGWGGRAGRRPATQCFFRQQSCTIAVASTPCVKGRSRVFWEDGAAHHKQEPLQAAPARRWKTTACIWPRCSACIRTGCGRNLRCEKGRRCLH